MRESANDLIVTAADVKAALQKKKASRSPGSNCITYELLKLAYRADPEYFTAVCNFETNSFASVEAFKK